MFANVRYRFIIRCWVEHKSQIPLDRVIIWMRVSLSKKHAKAKTRPPVNPSSLCTNSRWRNVYIKASKCTGLIYFFLVWTVRRRIFKKLVKSQDQFTSFSFGSRITESSKVNRITKLIDFINWSSSKNL